MQERSMLGQVQIRNYKNIASSVVELHPLTVLVGPNGAGKSNFVDALSFVADSLSHSIQLAFANRGGAAAVRRKSGGRPTHIGMRLRLALADGGRAHYAFEIAARPTGAFYVARESCVIQLFMQKEHGFEVRDGKFTREVPGIRPRVEADRLALTLLAGAEEFRPVYDFLTGIRRYNLRPERLRELQDPDPGEGQVLLEDGSNAAAVLRRISQDRGANGHAYERINRLLSKIVPGTTEVLPKPLGQKETLEFFQDAGHQRWRFSALNMSDGTLRVLGILLAVYQPQPASMIIVEEPESTIHPAATDILMDILLDGMRRSQVLVTTHSPEVLDHKGLSEDQFIAVESVQGIAQLTPLTPATRDVISRKLYTPGELLRQGELQTDPRHAESSSRQLQLFGTEE